MVIVSLCLSSSLSLSPLSSLFSHKIIAVGAGPREEGAGEEERFGGGGGLLSRVLKLLMTVLFLFLSLPPLSPSPHSLSPFHSSLRPPPPKLLLNFLIWRLLDGTRLLVRPVAHLRCACCRLSGAARKPVYFIVEIGSWTQRGPEGPQCSREILYLLDSQV
jgi:hypothetical protein